MNPHPNNSWRQHLTVYALFIAVFIALVIFSACSSCPNPKTYKAPPPTACETFGDRLYVLCWQDVACTRAVLTTRPYFLPKGDRARFVDVCEHEKYATNGVLKCTNKATTARAMFECTVDDKPSKR